MRAAFYADVVGCLDEVYGGAGAAEVAKYTSWGAKDRLFGDILMPNNWTVQRARDDECLDVMCLGADESIAQHMLRLWEVRRGGGQMLTYDPGEHELATTGLNLLENLHDAHQRSVVLSSGKQQVGSEWALLQHFEVSLPQVHWHNLWCTRQEVALCGCQ